jgi:hypothetical protein
MPYSCTSVLRDGPIYINASVISVLFPDAMSRTLGSASLRSNNILHICTCEFFSNGVRVIRTDTFAVQNLGKGM